MKKIFFLISIFYLLSACKDSDKTISKSEVGTSSELIENQELKVHELEASELGEQIEKAPMVADSISVSHANIKENGEEKFMEALKITHIEANSLDERDWKDLKCTVCSKRCCTYCTSDGDRNRCSKTKFTKCSVCSHYSSRHISVNH